MDLGETGRLLLAALDGEPEARSSLLDRLRPRIVLWATARMSAALRAQVDPEDVAQEVLLAVHRGLDSWEGTHPRAFLKWLFRVGENRIRDLATHFGAEKRQAPTTPRGPLTQTSPSTAAALREEVGRVREALEALPDDYRDVIRLRRLEERPYEEVAAVLDRTVNAVRVLYCRAVKALGQTMRARESEGGD